jgi:hypothetical protein
MSDSNDSVGDADELALIPESNAWLISKGKSKY